MTMRCIRATRAAPSLLLLLLLLLCVCGVGRVDAVKFALDSDKKVVCFAAEVLSNSEYLTGVYTRQADKAHDMTDVQLELRTPHDEVVNSVNVTVGEHAFSFAMRGAPAASYMVCMHATNARTPANANEPLWLTLSIDHARPESTLLHGEFKHDDLHRRPVVNGMEVFEFTDYGGQRKSALQPREYLRAVDMALINVAFLLTHLNTSASETLNSSMRMRDTSESTFTRVWVCAVLVIAALVTTVWMQFRLLRRIIVHKKIV